VHSEHRGNERFPLVSIFMLYKVHGLPHIEALGEHARAMLNAMHLCDGAGTIVLNLVVADVQLGQVLIRVLLQSSRQCRCSRIAKAIAAEIDNHLPQLGAQQLFNDIPPVPWLAAGTCRASRLLHCAPSASSSRTSDWLYMSRSAMALAPLSEPILHHPSFSVST